LMIFVSLMAAGINVFDLTIGGIYHDLCCFLGHFRGLSMSEWMCFGSLEMRAPAKLDRLLDKANKVSRMIRPERLVYV